MDGREDQRGVHLFRGGKGGLSGSRSSWVPQTVMGRADEGVSFGGSLRLRDLTRDGRADLALGAQQQGVLLRGTSTGPATGAAVALPEFGGGFLD